MLEKIQEDLKQAQLRRDEVKVSTLRLLISEINNARIAKGDELSDQEVTSVIQKEAKKRRESIESFKKGGREDLAQKEESELNILAVYLPAQLSDEELTKLIEESITELETMQDMGKVMSSVMSKVAGRADGATVSRLVREKLSR